MGCRGAAHGVEFSLCQVLYNILSTYASYSFSVQPSLAVSVVGVMHSAMLGYAKLARCCLLSAWRWWGLLLYLPVAVGREP